MKFNHAEMQSNVKRKSREGTVFDFFYLGRRNLTEESKWISVLEGDKDSLKLLRCWGREGKGGGILYGNGIYVCL